ncbi:hypothetical protein [Sphingobacterium lactis]|uniref:hypothetical protein n=1 Tax=Sphingobacterium lactis TaxID=797291 RepID=UPI003DA3D3C4
MKNLFFFLSLFTSILLSSGLTSCNKDIDNHPVNMELAAEQLTPEASIPVDEDGMITKDFLSKDTVWLLDGVSYVPDGFTLTIEKGTKVVSGATKLYTHEDGQNHHIKGVLVVLKGGKLIAEGTANEPIVFTSDKAPGQRKTGDFGGIVLLGKAPINPTEPTVIEGIPQPGEVDVTYGGNQPNDNSGILKYVRIEFAGYNLAQDNEINGLTCGGVGNGTVLEYIQVSWGRDDAFEFFGGTVNAKYLVASSTDDDDYDFDFGYSGTIQYALSLKDPKSTNSWDRNGISDSNGIESDNNGQGDKRDPTTRPVLKNFTFIGIQDSAVADKKLRYGNRWRRASSMNITNSIIAGYSVGASFEDITEEGSVFSNNVIHAYKQAFIGTVPGTGNIVHVSNDAASFLDLTGRNSIFYVSNDPDITLYNPAMLRPRAGSPAYGDGSTTFKGAFHPKQRAWTSGWTQFSPNTY